MSYGHHLRGARQKVRLCYYFRQIVVSGPLPWQLKFHCTDPKSPLKQPLAVALIGTSSAGKKTQVINNVVL